MNDGTTGPTKSGKTRYVPLTPALAAALKGMKHLKSKLVFCNKDGSPMTLWQLHERLEGACRRAGLRRILRIPAIVNTWTAHREHPVIGAKRRAPIGAKRRVLLGSRPVVDDPFYDAPRRLLGGSVRVQPSVPSLVLRREGPLRASL
jgi:hypothetical protein